MQIELGQDSGRGDVEHGDKRVGRRCALGEDVDDPLDEVQTTRLAQLAADGVIGGETDQVDRMAGHPAVERGVELLSAAERSARKCERAGTHCSGKQAHKAVKAAA